VRLSLSLGRIDGPEQAAMKLRTLIFWPHLIAGIIAGVVILVMSVTGVILTYERQLVAWSDSHYRSVPAPGATRLPVEALLQTIREQHADLTPTAVTFAAEADAPATVTVPQRTLYFDAYSGRLLGEGGRGMRRFMSETRAWHRWLAVEGEGRPVARFITGWSNFIFLFIVVSGFYLWFPRRWTWAQVRSVVLFNPKATGKARDFNWHNVIGVWSAVPLFIVVLSAFPISFPWANALVYRVVGEEPAAARGREGGAARGREGGARREERAAPSLDGLNGLWTRAEQHVDGWRTINVRVPESNRAPVVFAIDKGDGGQPQLRSTLTLDRASGAVVSYEAFENQSLGRRLRSISRFAHTGEVLGIPGQTIAGLATAGSVVLVWTGLTLAWRRWRAWVKRRASERAEPISSQSSAA
jgi:uncharacterized iron-regulated membrane protein